ncbi:MAG: methyltransferase domain-containing protein [Bacteroidota bacterium]
MSQKLNAHYWNDRYRGHRIGWDIGHPSTPLKEYIDQLGDTSLKILIPGGGNAYEAEYLFKNGFTNVWVVDVATTAKARLLQRFSDFPEAQFLTMDFFDLVDSFDLILEQTFFCALEPAMREAYAQKMHQLLKPRGKLVGVLFDFPLAAGPPFGGSKTEYLRYFEPRFQIEILERCHNSIAPRQGHELFFKVQPKERGTV